MKQDEEKGGRERIRRTKGIGGQARRGGNKRKEGKGEQEDRGNGR